VEEPGGKDDGLRSVRLEQDCVLPAAQTSRRALYGWYPKRIRPDKKNAWAWSRSVGVGSVGGMHGSHENQQAARDVDRALD
jgi:hypothetical protein